MRIAINGFGRIGRMVFRAYLEHQENFPNIEIVAINDLGDPKQTAHLLKYDSNYGIINKEVVGKEGELLIDGKSYALVQNRNPEELPWSEHNIDLVIECTGVFTSREGAGKHITAGAKRVMISAPPKDEIDRVLLMGVNHNEYNPETDFIVSNASCTTNCLAPMAKVLQDNFGIKRGLVTTIHAYTNDQNLHDNDHKDWHRARAAALNMIPTSTGAAKAIGQVIPELSGKMNGVAIRVPIPVVSLVDLVAELEKDVTIDEIHNAMKAAAEGELKGILAYNDIPLVSSDFKGDNHSSIFDATQSQMIDGNMVKVFSWYDNEWGYSVRCLDLASHMASKE